MSLGVFDVFTVWELRDHISDFMHQIANNWLIPKFSFPSAKQERMTGILE